MGTSPPASLTLVMTIEELEADPPGHLLRAMVRSSGRPTRIIGPEFVRTEAELRARVAAVCSEVADTLGSR